MKSETMVAQSGNADKVKHYKWKVVDEPGTLKWINKELLETDKIYQRNHSPQKVLALASEWSWVACGAISVGKRYEDGYFIIDGQHRVLAALRRSDITELPCIVFDVQSIPEEADGFVRSNTHRKNMSIFDKHKANIVAKDPVACDLRDIFVSVGLIPTGSGTLKNGIKCIGMCYVLYKTDKQALIKALKISRMISENAPVTERTLGGLWYLEHNGIDIGDDGNFYKRLKAIPTSVLSRFIGESVAYYSAGGNKEYAVGILNAVNKGLRNKYVFKN